MRRVSAIAVGLGSVARGRRAAEAAASEGMSLFGDLKYGPGFTHFDYANPQAPKGGTMRLFGDRHLRHAQPVCHQRGAGGRHRHDLRHPVGLLRRRAGERIRAGRRKASTSPPDKLSVLYTLRKEARFHDGTPMTPEDVIWTFETLRAKGLPIYRAYYGDVTKVEKEGDRGVRFYFKSAKNRELPQILGADAGAVEGLLVGPRFREDDARSAARQRPLQDPVDRPRPLDHLSPGRRLLGRRSAGQQGPLQCRHDPLRLLPRRHDRARGVQGRPVRRPAREFVKGLGDRL